MWFGVGLGLHECDVTLSRISTAPQFCQPACQSFERVAEGMAIGQGDATEICGHDTIAIIWV